jgi:hypothetical protein
MSWEKNDKKNVDPNQIRINSIKQDVAGKMNMFERQSILNNETTVIGLYLHWFQSVFTLFECTSHCLLLFMIILAFSLLYYVILVLSCGKMSSDYCAAMSHFIKLYWLYVAFFGGMLSNIVVPWSPPLYLWERGVTLIYPPGFERPVNFNRTDLCCLGLCNCLTGTVRPTWQVMETHLLTVGRCKCVPSIYCGTEAYTKGLQASDEKVQAESIKETMEFYNRTYGCASLDELIYVQVYGGGQQPQEIV